MRPAVLVVSSHVVRGAVGGRAGFALERAGFRLWSLPTVILPWHPGHGRAQRIVPDDAEFAALAADLAKSPWIGEIAAVLTGYLGSASQAEPIAALVRAVKAANPGALHLADPVIGDEGGLYVPPAVAEAQAEVLLPLADLATPNRFELAHLTGADTSSMAGLVAAARRLGPRTLLVTSAPALMRGQIGVALVGPEKVLTAETRVIADAPSGTGDLFSSLFLARKLGGESDEAALGGAVAGTFELVAASARSGSGELDLAAHQESLVHPRTPVEVRTFGEPRRPVARP